MFDTVDAAKSIPPQSVKKNHEQPDMNDIRNAMKVIGVIKKLINSDQLMLKPPSNQNGLVKKGLIPIEESRKFKSRVGSHRKSLDIAEEDNQNEDEEDEDDEQAFEKVVSKSKENKPLKEAPKLDKLENKVQMK